MSIPYKLTEVKDNISDEPKRGYYAKVVTRGTIDTLTLCRDISRTCTLTVADLRAAIERQNVTRTFERYVAPNVVNELLKEGIDNLKLGGKNVDIAVLFVDVRGFTTMSERL